MDIVGAYSYLTDKWDELSDQYAELQGARQHDRKRLETARGILEGMRDYLPPAAGNAYRRLKEVLAEEEAEKC